MIFSDALYKRVTDDLYLYNYSRILVSLDNNRNNKAFLIINYLTLPDSTNPHFTVNNEVAVTLQYVNALPEKTSLFTFYLGLTFALFSAFLLYGYLNITINARQKDIGILRALGARKNDIMKIFILESLLIGILSVIIASIGGFVINEVGNNILYNNYGLLIFVLDFGIIQVLLILGIAVTIALLSTFIPVYKYSKKKPIDVINKVL